MVALDKVVQVSLLSMLMLLSACSKSELVIWTAKQDTLLFRSPHDDELQQIGKIQAGEACVPGDMQIEKAFQYFEVLCQHGQYGWVIDSDHFSEIRSTESQRMKQRSN